MAAPVAKIGLRWWQWAAFPILGAVALLTYLWVKPALGFQSPGSARIIFFHVPIAELLFFWYAAAGYFGLRYLLNGARIWDVRSAAAAEVGLLCTVLALVSGSIFARIQWYSWWNWDPKQVAIVIVLMLFAAFFALRGAVENPDLRGRLADVTVILGEDSEPQPDACLIIEPTRGGHTHELPDATGADSWLAGPPELVVEVASSSVAYDLHSKKRDYERYGVGEYLVIVLREPQVLWFGRRGERFAERSPDAEGILRSEVFPGLWLDPAALLRRDGAALRAVLERGLATPEHAAFARRLGDKSNEN